MSSDIASVRIKDMADEIVQLKAENAKMRELLNEVAEQILVNNKTIKYYLKTTVPNGK